MIDRTKGVLIGVMAPLLFVASVNACECVTLPLKQAFKMSRAFFVGTVLSGDASTEVATVRVDEPFEGVRRGETVLVDGVGGCGTYLKTGEKYLVETFAGEFDNSLRSPREIMLVFMCSHTHLVSAAGTEKEIALLRRRAWWWRLPLSGRRRCAICPPHCVDRRPLTPIPGSAGLGFSASWPARSFSRASTRASRTDRGLRSRTVWLRRIANKSPDPSSARRW